MPSPKPPQQTSLVGYTIGKCKLLRVAGRGAMGTVYQGMHLGLDIDVAVKILPPHLANNSNLVERFMREAKLAARLNHINTVRVYDVGAESGYYYLVMEFIEGADALALIKQHGPQQAHVVADIGAGTARALYHAHESGVIHRDIKPANLMLPETGGVKVADFGLARALASESGLTMTGAVMGTPDYMAPEQAQGQSVGREADVYSLGGTLYHLFVGRPPFTGPTPMSVALQHVTSRIVVPEEMVRTAADKELTRLIHACTSKDPAKRPSDLSLLEERLTEIARSNKNTAKLLYEGATLFATAGFKLDPAAIRIAREEAEFAAKSDKGRVESPHLDKLREAAATARRKATRAVEAERPVRRVSHDLADLNADMVREAKAKARRSSGQIRALPPETGARAHSNPAMSPHRDPRPAASSSRRAKMVQNPELDDDAWQGYAAKSFPTFDKGNIMDGSAGNLARGDSTPWAEAADVGGGAGGGDSGLHPFAGDANFASAQESYGSPAAAKRGGGGVGLVVALLLIAAAAGGGWYFLVYKKGADGGGGTPVQLQASAISWQGHRSRVTAILSLPGGNSFLTAGKKGQIHRWDPPERQPASSHTLKDSYVIVMVLNVEMSRLAIGLADGRVMLLEPNALEVTGAEVARVEGAVTALVWPAEGLWIGTSKGIVQNVDGSIEVGVSRQGSGVNGLVVRGRKLWACAGNEIVVYDWTDDGLTTDSRVSGIDGTVSGMIGVPAGVFAVVGDELRPLLETGPTGVRFALRRRLLTGAGGGNYIAVVSSAGLVYLDPATLLPTSNVIVVPEKATALGTAPGARGVAVGTENGNIYFITAG